MDFNMNYFIYIFVGFYLISCSTINTDFQNRVSNYKDNDNKKINSRLSIDECTSFKEATCIKIRKSIFYIPRECDYIYNGEWEFGGVVNNVIEFLPALHQNNSRSIIESSTDKSVNLIFVHGITGYVYAIEIEEIDTFKSREKQNVVYRLSEDFKDKLPPDNIAIGECQ